MDRRWVPAAASLVFLAFLTYVIYTWNDASVFDHLPGAAWIFLFIALYAITGLLIGQWWAVLLAIAPMVIALPAGTDGDGMAISLIWSYDSILLGPFLLAGVYYRRLRA